MRDSYDGKDLVRYLGSINSAIGVVLFFVGTAGVLVSAIAIASGFSWQAEDKGLLTIPAWSLVAIPLAFAMRRNRPNSILVTFAGFWLALGFGAMLVTNYLG